MTLKIRSEQDPTVRRAVQEAITARLPQWFGIPDSNRHYAEKSETLPGWIASVDGRDVGLAVLARHGAIGGEIYWIGVDPEYHRHGIGRALLQPICDLLIAEKRRLLFVLTMPPDDPDEGYQHTRRFYEGMGFAVALNEHGDNKFPLTYYVKFLNE